MTAPASASVWADPGMSAALARLRATFGDELFVRIPGKPMRPTTRAIALHGLELPIFWQA